MTQWALVTGAAKRIGRIIALELARNGWDIIVHYNGSQQEAETLADEIQAMGRAACLAEIDFLQRKPIENLISSLTAEIGPIAALINNASLFEPETIAPDNGRHMMINAEAPRILSEAFHRQDLSNSPPLEGGVSGGGGTLGLKSQEQKPAQGMLSAPPPYSSPSRGEETPPLILSPVIINLLDTDPTKEIFSAYNASKIALQGMTIQMAKAFAPNTRVNGVALGAILPSPRESATHFQTLVEATPLKKQPTPEAVAAAVRFLVENPFVTGEIIHIDGGAHLNRK